MLVIFAGILSAISFFSSVWLIVIAFKKSRSWGFGVLFVPFVTVHFAVKNWKDAKRPFLLYLSTWAGALVLAIFAAFSSPGDGDLLNRTRPSIQVQLARDVSQKGPTRSLSQKEVTAILALEQKLKTLKNLPKTPKQEQLLRVTQKNIQFKKTVLSSKALGEFKKEVESLLKKGSLNNNERQGFETLLKEIKEQALPVVANPSIPSQEARIEAPETRQDTRAIETTGDAIKQKIAVPKKHIPKPLPEKKSRYKKVYFSQAKNHLGSEITFIGPRGAEQTCTLVDISDNEMKCKKQFNDGTFLFTLNKSEVRSLKVLRH